MLGCGSPDHRDTDADPSPLDVSAFSDVRADAGGVVHDTTPASDQTNASCDEGPCCVDGALAGSDHVCLAEAARAFSCLNAPRCGGALRLRTSARYCSGRSPWCDGPEGWWSAWETIAACGHDELCDATEGACLPSPHCACETRCDDGDPCTEDLCREDGGCEHLPDDCDDGDACTSDACVPGEGCQHCPIDCNDGDPCTDDTCDPELGCRRWPRLCVDGDACTADDCLLGECVFSPIDWDDGDTCSVEICDPIDGLHVEYLPDGEPCSRDGETSECSNGRCCVPDCAGRACGNDGCGGSCGQCRGLGPCFENPMCTPEGQCEVVGVDCDDGLACTNDYCELSSGCVHEPRDALCDDGVDCTLDLCLPWRGGCVNDDLLCDCTDDGFEDNDTKETAYPLGVGHHVIEAESVMGESDFWRVDVEPGMHLQVRLVPRPEEETRWVWFNERHLLTYAWVDDLRDCEFDIWASETLYFEVLPPNYGGDAPGCSSYTLEIALSPPEPDRLTCNVACPDLPCYRTYCNERNHCEYAPEENLGDEATALGHERLVWVPRGSFVLGPPDGPVITHEPGFWIDKYEVTAAAYEAGPARLPWFDPTYQQGHDDPWDLTLSRNPDDDTPEMGQHCQSEPGGPRGSCAQHPITEVTADWAEDHCRWRGGFLCTEAQWERAARGTDQRTLPWGAGPHPGEPGWDPARANCAESLCGDGFERTAPVDYFPGDLSPVGCVGMAGNVSELVMDFWSALTGAVPEDIAPSGHPADYSFTYSGGPVYRYGNVIRGSSWHRVEEDGNQLLVRHGASYGWEWLGFRCCRSVKGMPIFYS